MGDTELLREIGTRIYIRRKERRLTQEQLAEKINVSVQMISNLESGKKAVRPENLVKLCNALDISADYILFGRIGKDMSDGLFETLQKLSESERILIKQLAEALAKKNGK